MKLSRRIAAADLDPAARRRFLELLRDTAKADGRIVEEEFSLIEKLLPGADAPGVEPGALESLWPHAELVVAACLYVSVSDGEYCVDEARHISRLAHSLGMSAHQLSEVEQRVFAELKDRGGRKSGERAG